MFQRAKIVVTSNLLKKKIVVKTFWGIKGGHCLAWKGETNFLGKVTPFFNHLLSNNDFLRKARIKEQVFLQRRISATEQGQILIK